MAAMVAITGGQGLGVNLGLAGVLGDRALAGQAQAGRNGQRVYVNGSTGNRALYRFRVDCPGLRAVRLGRVFSLTVKNPGDYYLPTDR
jgi:hypothetical protein